MYQYLYYRPSDKVILIFKYQNYKIRHLSYHATWLLKAIYAYNFVSGTYLASGQADHAERQVPRADSVIFWMTVP